MRGGPARRGRAGPPSRLPPRAAHARVCRPRGRRGRAAVSARSRWRVRGERDPAARAIGRDRGLERVDRLVRSSGRRQGAAERSCGRAGERGCPHEHDHAVGEGLQQRDDRGGALGVADGGARLRELREADQRGWRHAACARGPRPPPRPAARAPRPPRRARRGRARGRPGTTAPPAMRSGLAGSRGRPPATPLRRRAACTGSTEHEVGVVVPDTLRLSVRLVREPSCRGKLAPVARERRTPGRHVPRERRQPRLGGQLLVEPDLIGRRSDVALLEQVDDAPVPPVQLDLRVARALAERDELVGGGEPDAQMLRAPSARRARP